MFLGWITGMHPPGKILACITAGKVVMHKLQAHCEAYEAIKRTPLGKSLQVTCLHDRCTVTWTAFMCKPHFKHYIQISMYHLCSLMQLHLAS
jgi:beta-glucosidase/6-phospho-beta-glucosidase/beta-galactosidase